MKRKALLAALTTVVMVLAVVTVASATGAVGTAAGFEDNDGNLAVNTAGLTDWNSFAPTSWQPSPTSTPTRITSKVANGWQFAGFEDWQATTSDSGFAGGVKQDEDCPSVITAKADNKADLKRIYLASKTVDGHTYLMLAWDRIPQNTTSPSAHTAFEFNQNNPALPGFGPCPTGGLVHRQAGDMLVLYDFEGGATSTPTIGLERWVTASTDTCEISSDVPPCWGTEVVPLPSTQAEAAVDTGVSPFPGSVSDALAPPALSSTSGTSVTESIGTNEFGEAGIDLTNAGVFTAGTCTTFGQAHGESRTSGNAGTAQMKDLVGPGPFTLSNCGEIKIIKHTNPRGLNQNFSYTSTIPSSSKCVRDATPAGFSLNDSGNTSSDNSANTEDCTNVPAGGPYTVTEGSNPPGFAFQSLACTASGVGTSVSPDGTSTSTETASITISGGGVVTCVYTNKQQLGAIKITKTAKNANLGTGDHPQSGVTFTITGPGGFSATGVTDANGRICVDHLVFGSYGVTETVPSGYKADSTNPRTVSVGTNAACGSGNEATAAFHNTPLSQIRVTFHSKAGLGVTTATIQCTGDTSVSDLPDNSTGRLLGNLTPGTYTCTVVVDP